MLYEVVEYIRFPHPLERHGEHESCSKCGQYTEYELKQKFDSYENESGYPAAVVRDIVETDSNGEPKVIGKTAVIRSGLLTITIRAIRHDCVDDYGDF